MPTTVPNSPSKGLIEAIVPNEVRKRSSSCVTARPASSMDSFITSGVTFDVLQAGSENASQRRTGGKLGQHAVADAALLEFLDDLVKQGGGEIRLLRKNTMRSMIKPTAMMDARIKNQIGQPAASTIANTRILQMCLNYQGATVTCRNELSKISQVFLQQVLLTCHLKRVFLFTHKTC